MLKKIFFILIALSIVLPHTLYAQAKPKRDTSKDNSVLVAKQKEEKRKQEQKRKEELQRAQASKARRRKSPVKEYTNPPQATYLNVNQQTALFQTFRHSGETKYFSVRTDGQNWSIGSVPMWCTINKYSNYFTLECDPNPYHDDRNCRISVNSDNKEVCIDITQPGAPMKIEAKFEDAYLKHNVYRDWKNRNCLEINANITIKGARGQKCFIVALFYDEYGNSIQADTKYPNYSLASNGDLYAATEIVPISDYPQKHNVSFYLPNNAMKFWGKKKKLQCRLYLYCVKTNTYINGASYNLKLKAKKKKGNIKTKKMK